ncbi:hypothetical protein [Sporosarcina sp. Te-1]|uniref:hypothetical protein n=1 Tax=Sporosarcina sp. Te-1 TaxID=2818390 RepID=UPI001A9F6F43|nr:hypothetical protein [Sporosarcina sp. Te-1]QTD40914.1 hypothetical protein J3U78_19580 [Sporosarcina sp. Te-1]
MAFVMLTIVIYSIPGLMIISSAYDVKVGKRASVKWKWPALFLFILAPTGLATQYYFQQTYHFPFFQTNTENWVAGIVIALLAGIILLINLIITLTIGKKLPKSVHNPKNVNIFTACIVVYLFMILFIAAPTGKKIAFSTAIDQALQASEVSQTEEFPVVLVTSERDCLQNTASCRNSPYSNQFFIRNNLSKTQEVQVKTRALSASGIEMKVIDSHIMTLRPGELRLVETEETSKDASPWNMYSFQTDHPISEHQYITRYQDPQ